MYKEINVSKREFVNNEPSYHHLFATHQRSLTTDEKLKRCLEIIVKKFPYPDYQIVVILCNHWSINKPKYTDEEMENGVDESDWNELEDVLGFVLEVNDYDDLIVDPYGSMD